jgi:protein gp37
VADTSKIEWTDATWNVVTGCEKVSPGCDRCYAETFAERWRGIPGHHFENGFDITLRPERLALPLRWRKPKRVFVNSMSDLFHKDIPDEYIARVFAVMALTPQHTYQILTKRHGRMRSLIGGPHKVDTERGYTPGVWFRSLVQYATHELGSEVNLFGSDSRWPLPNVWLGVSVEDQKRADLRIPALVDTPAAVRFLSCEPLLGPVDLTAWMPGGHALWLCQGPDCRRFYSGPLQQHCPDCGREGHWTGSHTGNGRPNGQPIGWVIAGGESGHGARPMSPDWARSLRDQCQKAGVAYLFKQWGEYQPTGYMAIGARQKGCVFVGDPIDDLGHRWEMRRVGKGKAGRELDGRTWDEFPKPESTVNTGAAA